MKFPGYWVSMGEGKVMLERTTLDETELDPATNWKQAWQNQAVESQVKGYVELEAALISAATSLARASGVEERNNCDFERISCDLNEYSANDDLLGASQPGQLTGSTDRIKQSGACLEVPGRDAELQSQ